jgi:hypothetical protein
MKIAFLDENTVEIEYIRLRKINFVIRRKEK